jgi:hypothetical protein
MKIALTQRQASAGVYGFFLLFSIAAYSVTAGFPSPLIPGYPGSAMFPRLVLITMGVICLWGIATMLLTGRGATGARSIEIPMQSFLLIMGMLGAFAVMLTLAGMEVAILVMIGVTIWIRTRNLIISAVSGISAIAIVYLVFVQLLSVPLPLLFLPRYLLRF